ncbi:hypothetical protein N7495_005534 [Penicillium taxi]|uniref:uncharacterized protein n=1 Tax=Penicillium taxi TaxID=168475 RepID=UPI0025450B8F|nr:uncharacterized protein N7495_005534 [Penicillium taxi]KAJ5893843.1 hypothetical protein N7495_005534 [Penicillium taxi]
MPTRQSILKEEPVIPTAVQLHTADGQDLIIGTCAGTKCQLGQRMQQMPSRNYAFADLKKTFGRVPFIET